MGELELERLAGEFAARVPEGRVAGAEVLEFLMGWRGDAGGAVRGVGGWVAGMSEERGWGR